jgi:hypothetical protein
MGSKTRIFNPVQFHPPIKLQIIMKPPSQIRIESLKFSKESEIRLQQRFGLSIEKLKKEITNFKIANNQTRHPEIQKKLRNPNHTGMKYLYHERLNMFFPVIVHSHIVTTVLLLDGRWGYDFYMN